MQLESLARIQLSAGRWAEAGPNVGEALRIASQVGNRVRLADCLGTAAVWAATYSPEAAAVLWGASRALGQAIGWDRVAIADIADSADTGSASDSLSTPPRCLPSVPSLDPSAPGWPTSEGRTCPSTPCSVGS